MEFFVGQFFVVLLNPQFICEVAIVGSPSFVLQVGLGLGRAYMLAIGFRSSCVASVRYSSVHECACIYNAHKNVYADEYHVHLIRDGTNLPCSYSRDSLG